jgi:hypothetical protein
VRFKIRGRPRETLREATWPRQEGFPPLHLRLHISITLLTIPHRRAVAVFGRVIYDPDPDHWVSQYGESPEKSYEFDLLRSISEIS